MAAVADFNLRPTRTSLISALVRSARRFGAKRAAIVDGDERKLTYGEILTAAFALGSALRKGTKRAESVGVLLPTGAGSIIAFYALQAYGRVPAMLNFTAGVRNLKSALKTAEVKKVVTAHKFVELGKLEPLIKELSEDVEFIYLEDVREKLSLRDKLNAAVARVLPGLVAVRRHPDAPAVVLFTSGTEGDPKGVVLSHSALLANVEQVRCHIELHDTDIVFNPLPTFHCFGLTVGALMPLVLGIKTVLHPTPLQPREIAKRIRSSGSTILLATDTFISQYARAGDQGDLNSLRLAVCGAERVRDETRQTIRKKYAIDILEGYGVTEAAPVVAANQVRANRSGTVGKLMSGMEYRLEPVVGIEGAGRLFVRGPNIMRGYLFSDEPGKIHPPKDGWHDTGDVVSIDDEGFISIRGRVKRFAKIGGEMVSLAVVENCASALWPDHMHAAVAVEDGRKGEQIILLSDADEANRESLIGWAKNHGVPELAVPRRVFHVKSVPLLGTGKTDYGAVQRMADDLMPKLIKGPKPEMGPEKPAPEPETKKPNGAATDASAPSPEAASAEAATAKASEKKAASKGAGDQDKAASA